ncbi:hypothetical protein [Frigoriglobus tundricola]|uniref:TIGR03000 domain-containing protein n=1 Tax=Frigoriglobus tundricola TaxID=2774151 RepID=A0A6M5YNN1_9BACT|nr:hypothetical protein [Frigoriglobus tundricola]QJW95667.1 hypothetical protein FTUN_3221 [Frigoriglobus tundricola]
MFRTLAVLGTLVAFTATATAQPGTTRNWPYVPGAPLPAASVPQGSQGTTVYFPVALPTGWGIGWGYQTYNPWTGFSYAFGGIVPTNPTPPETPAPTAESPRRPEAAVVLSNEFPATLALQFPAAAEVWLDGKKVSGDAATERVLKSPVLRPDQTYAFNVKARWTTGDKTYEATRVVKLGSGDRSRLLIVSGDEVRK